MVGSLRLKVHTIFIDRVEQKTPIDFTDVDTHKNGRTNCGGLLVRNLWNMKTKINCICYNIYLHYI